LITVLGWEVCYFPARPFNYSSTEVNVFTGERGETVERKSTTVSHCIFGYGADWRVCYTWNRGDDQAPTRIQEAGDVVPICSESQKSMFPDSDAPVV
jgi:hypothetical protein